MEIPKVVLFLAVNLTIINKAHSQWLIGKIQQKRGINEKIANCNS
jgi:hypothetical protein